MMIGLWPAVFSLKKWEDRVVLFLGMGSVILALCLLYLGLNLEKVDGSAQKSRGGHLSRPRRPMWDPLAAILDFAGGAALQVVRECPLRR